MGEKAVRDWLGGLLVEQIGLSESEASVVAAKCTKDRNGNFSLGQAVDCAAAVMATPRLPVAWWDGEGQLWKSFLIEKGDVGVVESEVAEALAVPAPDGWDQNWPEAKRFRVVDIPEGASTGDEFVVGDGMGLRGVFRVAEVEGQQGAELLSASYSLDELSEEAATRAEALFGLDENV